MTRAPPPYRPLGVIFDLDGILVHSTPMHWEAFRRTFAAVGREFSFADYHRVASGASRDIVIRRVLGDLPAAELEALMQAKERHVRDCLRERGIEAVPGAVEFLRAARRRGLKTAVATASRTPDLLLGAAGFTDPFDAVIGRHHVARSKPFPDIYLAAAAALALPPERCLALEDSPVGIEAALAAGLRVLALATTEPEEHLGRAHAVYGSFAEIEVDRWLGPEE
jgi:beta-phosphoglucomutase